jgi:hypothetical protein
MFSRVATTLRKTIGGIVVMVGILCYFLGELILGSERCPHCGSPTVGKYQCPHCGKLPS